MPSLQELLDQALGQQIMSPEQMQQRIDAQTAAAMPQMLRQYGNTQQSLLENMFARGMGSGMMPSNFTSPNAQAQPNGMGLSTYLAQQLAPLQAQQSEAAARIRQQATNDAQAAQNAALGNAASYTSGQQQRATAERINAANRSSAASMNRSNQLMQGLTGLGGGVGKVGLGMLTAKPGDAGSGSTMMGNIKGLLGLGGPGAPAGPIPNVAATPGVAGEAGPPPSFGGEDTYSAPAGIFSGAPEMGPASYEGLGDNTGAFDMGGSGNLFDWATPGVNTSSLWNLLDFGQEA